MHLPFVKLNLSQEIGGWACFVEIFGVWLFPLWNSYKGDVSIAMQSSLTTRDPPVPTIALAS